MCHIKNYIIIYFQQFLAPWCYCHGMWGFCAIARANGKKSSEVAKRERVFIGMSLIRDARTFDGRGWCSSRRINTNTQSPCLLQLHLKTRGGGEGAPRSDVHSSWFLRWLIYGVMGSFISLTTKHPLSLSIALSLSFIVADAAACWQRERYRGKTVPK